MSTKLNKYLTEAKRGSRINFVASYDGTVIRIKGKLSEGEDSDTIGDFIYDKIGKTLATIKKKTGHSVDEVVIKLK